MKYILSVYFGLSALLFISCGEETTRTIDLEEEQFTNFQMTFNPIGGGDQVVFGSEDLGDLGIARAQASGPLMAGTLYDARVVIFNRKVEPGKNLTAAIREAGNDYQLFVVAEPDNIFQNIDYEDMDDNGNPLGLNMSFETSDRFVAGQIRFVLKRNPNKSELFTPGMSIPNSVGGEDLIDVSMEVIVQ